MTHPDHGASDPYGARLPAAAARHPLIAAGVVALLVTAGVQWLAVMAVNASRCESQEPWGCLGMMLLALAIGVPAEALLLALTLRALRIHHPWVLACLGVGSVMFTWQYLPTALAHLLAWFPAPVAVPLLCAAVTSAWAGLLRRR